MVPTTMKEIVQEIIEGIHIIGVATATEEVEDIISSRTLIMIIWTDSADRVGGTLITNLIINQNSKTITEIKIYTNSKDYKVQM